jgi:predicted  nucleic acid-binding Zn-ribbon protein
MEGNSSGGPTLAVYESVRCLNCGTVYAKPARGGTERLNPGCPECSYVGWLSVDLPLRPASEPRRSGEDPPLDRSAQSR